jgi:hypothetical protein
MSAFGPGHAGLGRHNSQVSSWRDRAGSHCSGARSLDKLRALDKLQGWRYSGSPSALMMTYAAFVLACAADRRSLLFTLVGQVQIDSAEMKAFPTAGAMTKMAFQLSFIAVAGSRKPRLR